MSGLGDGTFWAGDPVWVMQSDGTRRAGQYLGAREASAWTGGSEKAFVVYLDTQSGGEVEVDRVVPRALDPWCAR